MEILRFDVRIDKLAFDGIAVVLGLVEGDVGFTKIADVVTG